MASRLITEGPSYTIRDYCHRTFQLEALQDLLYIQQDHYPWQVPGGVYPLQLSRWPLVNTPPLTFTATTNGSNTLTGISSFTGLVPGMLVFASDGSLPVGTVISSISLGTGADASTPTADSSTTTADAGSTPLIVLSNPSSSSAAGVTFTTGLQVTQIMAVGDPQILVYGTDFTVDAKKGWLIRLDKFTGVSVKWEAVPTIVQYQAGFSSIPFALQTAAKRLVAARWFARTRDPMQIEKLTPGVGSMRYWVGAQPGQVGMLPPDVRGLVDHFRVKVVA